jgi:spermidine synthase
MFIAGTSGFIALGYEMSWFRVLVLASSDRAPAFALLLSTDLAGIAAGSYIAGKSSKGKGSIEVLRIIGILMMVSAAISVYLPPLVAFLKWKNFPFMFSSFFFFVAAALLGAVFPLACKIAVKEDGRSGQRVSSFMYQTSSVRP